MYKIQNNTAASSSSSPSLWLHSETNRAPWGVCNTGDNQENLCQRNWHGVVSQLNGTSCLMLMGWVFFLFFFFCFLQLVCKNKHTYSPIVHTAMPQLRIMMQWLVAPLNHAKLVFVQQSYIFLLLFRCWDTYYLSLGEKKIIGELRSAPFGPRWLHGPWAWPGGLA